MTQAALARLADIDQSSISRYLRGECEPNLRQFRAIAKALEVAPSELFPEGEPLKIVSGAEGRWHVFADGTYLGEWRGTTLDALRAHEVVDGDAARPYLDRIEGAKASTGKPAKTGKRKK